MTISPPRINRRLYVGATGVLLASAALTTALGLHWRAEMSAPRVFLLGSGHYLSTLVVAGQARLLIATGDDQTGFMNALNQARFVTTRRLDVVVMAGGGNALQAPAAIRRDRHVRFIATLADLPGSLVAPVEGDHGQFALPTPSRLWLDGRISLTLDAIRRMDDNGESTAAWRAIVRHGETAIMILSDGRAAPLFPEIDAVNGLVVAGASPLDAWDAVAADAFIASAEVLDGRKMRLAATNHPASPRWAALVHAGEAVRLDFVTGGLALPRESMQPLHATPGPESTTILSPTRGPAVSEE